MNTRMEDKPMTQQQELFFVVAFVVDGETNKYLNDEDGPVDLDDPSIKVYEDIQSARKRAHLWHNGAIRAQAIRVHRDYLDVAAL